MLTVHFAEKNVKQFFKSVDGTYIFYCCIKQWRHRKKMLLVSSISLKCAWVNFADTNVFMTSISYFEFIDFVQLCVKTLFCLGL